MKQVLLSDQHGFRLQRNAKREFDAVTNIAGVKDRISSIASALEASDDNVCYVFGAGSQPRSTYIKLKQVKGIDVIWFGSILPKPMRVLSFLIASYAGLVKVNDPQNLEDVVLELSSMSMLVLYVFNRSLEKEFVRLVKECPTPKYYDFNVADDPSYLLYLVDGDNYESETGMVEYVSYGHECAVHLDY